MLYDFFEVYVDFLSIAFSLSNSADKDLKEVAQYLHNAVQWFEAFHALKGFAARNKLRRMVQISTIDRLLQGKYWLPEGTLACILNLLISSSPFVQGCSISKQALFTPNASHSCIVPHITYVCTSRRFVCITPQKWLHLTPTFLHNFQNACT